MGTGDGGGGEGEGGCRRAVARQAEARRRRRRRRMESNNCCVRLCRANILQIKRFSDFVNVGYQFPLAHTHTRTHTNTHTELHEHILTHNESASHWQCGVNEAATPPQKIYISKCQSWSEKEAKWK